MGNLVLDSNKTFRNNLILIITKTRKKGSEGEGCHHKKRVSFLNWDVNFSSYKTSHVQFADYITFHMSRGRLIVGSKNRSLMEQKKSYNMATKKLVL